MVVGAVATAAVAATTAVAAVAAAAVAVAAVAAAAVVLGLLLDLVCALYCVAAATLLLWCQVELESAACSGLRCIHPVGLFMIMRCVLCNCCLLRAPL